MDEDFTEADGLTSGTNRILELDPEGDVVLKCQDQDSNTTTAFRVSSKLLRLASPVFSNMFGPRFKEGQQLLEEQSPVVELEEDDASLMSKILSILHFQSGDESDIVDAEKLARLAIHCDKYDLENALRPWISRWFDKVGRPSELSGKLGLVLLAAYMMNDAARFREVSENALKEVPVELVKEWDEQELLALLPTVVLDAITVHIERTLHKLETELQDVESPLRLSLHCYETTHRMCTQCGRTLPEVAKKCHPCRNSDLSAKFCTSETRVASYFAMLQQVGLWPTVEPFRRFSVSSIISRLYRAQQDLKHTCTGGTFCPLRIHLSDLVERARQTEKSISGLCLHCFRDDDEWDENETCTHGDE